MAEIKLNRPRLLAVDDETSLLQLYKEVLVPARADQSADSKLDDLEARLFGSSGSPIEAPDEYDVVLCQQGDLAVEEVRRSVEQEKPFAAAFVDVRMPPGPDGVWTAENIRLLDPSTNIVIVTGFSDVDPIEIARRVPPADKLLYIQKPFHLHEIRQFALALTAKWVLELQLESMMMHLEHRVEERTSELANVNQELLEANRVLEKLSITDDLTKLYNKRYFNKKLQEWVIYSRRYHAPLSLVMFDIDHFKNFNDSKGHIAGDLLLERIGQIVTSTLRRQIDSAFSGVESTFRFGGEEFAIILPRTNANGAFVVAERLRTQVELETDVTISVGVAELADDMDGEEDLVRRADARLYQAKDKGRNQVCV